VAIHASGHDNVAIISVTKMLHAGTRLIQKECRAFRHAFD
jgi:hypothetical protein